MARDADGFTADLISRVEEVDPTIDVSKGPVYETMLYPWGYEGSYVEGKVEHLSAMWQLEDSTILYPDEVTLLGNNYGINPGEGSRSQGYLTFYTMQAPTSDILFSLGTLASTEDGTYLYRTTIELTMYATTATAYLNSAKKRYEIKIPAEAVERGSTYDVKRGRVNRIINAIQGIDGVINEADFEGGTSDQTTEEFALSLQELPLGNSLGTPGGFKSSIIRLSGGKVSDVAIVTPADVGVYERLSSTSMRLGIDLYVLGTNIGVAYQNYTTSGTEVQIFFDSKPALEVVSVLVDGSPASSFSLIGDTNISTRGTTQDQSVVSFVYPSGIVPGAGHAVYIVYTYNKLVNDLQAQIDSLTVDAFGTDVVVRAGKPVEFELEFSVESYGAGLRQADIEDWVFSWFQDPTLLTSTQRFIGEIDPATFASDLQGDLGVAILDIQKFKRNDEKATDEVQITMFEKNEYPVVNLVLHVSN